jgi:transcriptional regulator of acetoin/glycerol metabolism
VGTLGRNVLELLVIGDLGNGDALRQWLSDRAASEEETVRWGAASFPRNGATGEELWSLAANRMLGLESVEPRELVWSDPCMSRLRGFADRWSNRPALALIGDEGVGRESLARVIRATTAPSAPFIVHRAARFENARWVEDVARAVGGALHVRRPDMLPEPERRSFWSARSFRPSAGTTAIGDISPPEDRIVLPQLTDRPSDVGPIAEWVLHSVDAQLGRRRSSLRAETRALLQALPTPENVRTLRNVVIRGALNATGSEVRPEHLELPEATPGLVSVRAKVRETERREIESVLQGSGWNVTEAARRMELPRRTLVYRMSRLGLRRPRGAS